MLQEVELYWYIRAHCDMGWPAGVLNINIADRTGKFNH